MGVDTKTATIATLASLTAMLVALTAIGIVEQANAARSGPQWEYCYNSGPAPGVIAFNCSPNKGECQKAQGADPIATSGCYRRSL